MSKPAQSVFVFSIYLFVLGSILVVDALAATWTAWARRDEGSATQRGRENLLDS